MKNNMKRVRIERGEKTNNLLRVYYQDADTNHHYVWDKFITDRKTMRAISSVCKDAVLINKYRHRMIYECIVDSEKIAQAI